VRLAEKIAEGMRRDGISSIGWLDNQLVNYVRTDRSHRHPMDAMASAMAAMERAPDIFRKGYRRQCDATGRREIVARCFRLIDDL
jgi:hypothetical protein